MSELQEATKEFLVETHENLDQLDTDLVGLEKSTVQADVVARIFRTLHTIKGSCSFLGFPRLEAVAHAGEDLLGRLRDGNLALSPSIVEALLRMVDVIRQILANVELVGTDGAADDADLIDVLERLASESPLPSGELGAGDPSPDSLLSEVAVSGATPVAPGAVESAL